MKTHNFDYIRSYRDDEVNSILQKLIADPEFNRILNKIFSPDKVSAIKQSVKYINTIKDFQSRYIVEYAKSIIQKSVGSLSELGLSNLDPEKSYLFISNHRDIILDSAFLNEILHHNGFVTTEIAIGSNLLIYPWIKDLVKLNRSFIVRRDLTGKEMLAGSMRLSAYIRSKITKENSSVWIAQREGRTKDGNDQTQIGLLKMFNFSGEKSLAENFNELNIIPVSISYELEPCDAAKTQEIYNRQTNIEFVKTPEQDMISMARGIEDKKGNIHFNFGKIQDDYYTKLAEIPRQNDKYNYIAGAIDKEIHTGYKIRKYNYIAYDIINNNNVSFAQKYTKEQKDEFIDFAHAKIEPLEGEKSLLLKIFYELYANPLINLLKY